MFTPKELAKLHNQLATVPDTSLAWTALDALFDTAEANARLAVYAPLLTPEDRSWRAGYGQAIVDLTATLKALRQWTPLEDAQEPGDGGA